MMLVTALSHVEVAADKWNKQVGEQPADEDRNTGRRDLSKTTALFDS